jgi:hypothetical protein
MTWFLARDEPAPAPTHDRFHIAGLRHRASAMARQSSSQSAVSMPRVPVVSAARANLEAWTHLWIDGSQC